MRTEVRFLLAIGLMIVVLVGTNMLFPPVPPVEVETPVDTALVGEQPPPQAATTPDETPTVAEPARPPSPVPAQASAATPEPALAAAVPEEIVTVESSLYRFRFSNLGARLLSAELPQFEAFNSDGLVQLIPEGEDSTLGQRLLIAGDTVDLRRAPFIPSTDALRVTDAPATLRFTYDDPASDFGVTLEYTFRPDTYAVQVSGTVRGVNTGVLFTDMGSGVALNEAQEAEELRHSAYVFNDTDEGITAVSLSSVTEDRIVDGPLFWAAFKSKFFLLALLAGTSPTDDAYIGGLVVTVRDPGLMRANVTAGQPFGPGGRFAYRFYAGPQDFKRLSALGHDLQEVNPYGWKFMRPVIQPFTGLIIGILNWMHDRFNMAYGWVLMLFGVMMRIVFFPLYHRSMKAQLKNMAVQPLLRDIQTRYKDNPERMQKEMMKLYKEHGFNPLAGCLPMLLPWPVLVALFFVFQNTIELRGVPFLWLPDLSQADPLYILPIFLGLSMFLLQWVSFRSMDQSNPQMKMMMWLMPVFLMFIFFRLPSGLNLYYATANVATLPQQFWIAKERSRAKANAPTPPAPDPPEEAETPRPAKRSRERRKSRKR